MYFTKKEKRSAWVDCETGEVMSFWEACARAVCSYDFDETTDAGLFYEYFEIVENSEIKPGSFEYDRLVYDYENWCSSAHCKKMYRIYDYVKICLARDYCLDNNINYAAGYSSGFCPDWLDIFATDADASKIAQIIGAPELSREVLSSDGLLNDFGL